MDQMEHSLYDRLMATQQEMMNQLRVMQTNQLTMQQSMSSSRQPAFGTFETTQGTSPSEGQPLLTGTLDQPDMNRTAQPMHQPMHQPTAQKAPETKMDKGLLSGTLAQDPIHEWTYDIISSRSYLMGGEAMQEHQTDMRQRMQLGTLNALNGTVQTATGVGAFFAPGGLIASSAIGLGAGAAVAYGADEMMDGARDALAYQRILEEKGYKAFNVFEGRNDFGGIGMNLSQQQDLSSFMRDLAPDKLLKDEEIAKILDGALDGKLLKSTTDLKSFKKKFSDIVDSVKEVAVVMNTSLEEATKMLGELETRGIGATKATMLTAQAKVNASLQGVSADKAFQQTLSTADTLTMGSGMSAEKAMTEVGVSQYVTSSLYEQYKDTNPERYNYIKNNGGESTIAAQGASLIQGGLATLQQDLFLSQIGAAATVGEDGNVALDMDVVGRLERGELGDAEAVQAMANKVMNRLKPGQVEQFKNSAAELAKRQLTPAQQAAIARNVIQLLGPGMGRTEEAALIELGYAKNPTEASILLDQLNNTTAASIDEFAALSSREGLAAVKRVNSPSIFAEIKAGWNKAVTNPLGDVGQFVTDEIGSMTLALQKSIHNVDAVGGVRSDKIVKADEFYDRVYGKEDSYASAYEENLRSFFEVSKETKAKIETDSAWEHQRGTTRQRQHRRDVAGELTDSAIERYTIDNSSTSKDGMSTIEFQARAQRAIDQKLSLGELAELREGIKNGTYTGDGKRRAQALVDLTTGQEDVNSIDVYELAGGDYAEGGVAGEDKKSGLFDGKGTIGDFEKDFKERAEKLAKDKKAALDKAYKAAQTLDLSSEEAQKLHSAIARGDIEAAGQVTQSKDVLDPMRKAKGYQDKLAEGRELSNGLAGIVDNTNARTDAVSMSVGLLVDAKAMSKKDAELLFSDALSSAERIDEGIKEKNWSVEKIRDETLLMDDHFKGAFNALSDDEVKKYAQMVADLNTEDSYTMESFLTQNGTIDRDKVTSAVPNIIAAGSPDGSKTVKADGSKEIGEHKDAMGEMLETLTEETKMMKEAQKKMKNGLSYQYTSVM